jgi:hypothetical protein
LRTTHMVSELHGVKDASARMRDVWPSPTWRLE